MVIPTDGMSSKKPFNERLAEWILANAPASVILSRRLAITDQLRTGTALRQHLDTTTRRFDVLIELVEGDFSIFGQVLFVEHPASLPALFGQRSDASATILMR